MWHVAKCPKVVAGLISKVEMTLWVLRTLLELGMQPCARHGNFYTPRTPERTYALNHFDRSGISGDRRFPTSRGQGPSVGTHWVVRAY